MGKKIRNSRELLEACFTGLEWKYLMHNQDFLGEWAKGCESVDDVERLSILGHRIITDREMADPAIPHLPQARKRKVE